MKSKTISPICFRINTKSGVVVVMQRANGEVVTSNSKASKDDKFNIGVGQLIAMKRNEIKIRKEALKGMRTVREALKDGAMYYEDTEGYYATASKLFEKYRQQTDELIQDTLNHIRNLKKDLEMLYNGDYDRLPVGIKTGTEIYGVKNGSIVTIPVKSVKANEDGVITIN